jgi:hypothetical protein
MAAYIDHPERFSGEALRWLGRPHFALLLTAIALLRHVRDQQNGIVRRHLDHYYRTLLGMAPLPARPDRVAVLFQLSRSEAELLLPAGTQLQAGKDASGVDRVYRTANDLLIQRASVRDLRTVFVDRLISTLESLGRKTLAPGNQPELFDQALRLAIEVETLAHMYLQALVLGEPPVLAAEEMARVIALMGAMHYGRSPRA